MNTTEKKLQSALGLTDTESSIYLACLPYPAVGAAEAVRFTGMKRTTVYHALDALVAKGLAAKKQMRGKVVFSMLSPASLKHALVSEKQKIERQEVELSELVPILEGVKKDKIGVTQVEYYEGEAGVKAVYEEALNCKSSHWDTITPMQCFIEAYGEEFKLYVRNTRRERNIRSRALWEDIKRSKPKEKQTLSGRRDVRYLPKSMQGKFTSKIILFDNRVALIMPAQKSGAVLIRSDELHAAFQAVFDTIWGISEPLKV